MSKQLPHTSPAPGGGAGDEWAVGMPAYWLRLVSDAASAAEAQVLLRSYQVKPSTPAADYDRRLVVRVGGTAQALRAVVDFAFRYWVSMGHKAKTTASIQVVSERLVRAWELAGRPGAV